MKHRYPSKKDLMVALRARSPRRAVNTVNAKARAKRRTGTQEVIPLCFPYFL